MKKWLILFSSVTVLCLGLVIGAGVYLGAPHEQVTFQREVLVGEGLELDGLTAQYHATMVDQLFWDSTVELGTGKAETEFSMIYDRAYPNPEVSYYGVMPQVAVSTVLYNTPASYDGEFAALAQVYRDLEAATPNGGSLSKELYLKDYCSFYPIGGRLDLPGIYLYFDPVNAASDEHVLSRTFQNFFRIPVLESELFQVYCEKHPNGNVIGTGSGSMGSDSFQMEWVSLVTDRTCYFTFYPRSALGVPVDTSHIPGGYGIYALDYTGGDSAQSCQVHPESLRNILPLNPEVTVLALEPGTEQNTLLLFTLEDDSLVLTVLDETTMTQLQRIPLVETGTQLGNHILFSRGEGWLLCRIDGELLAVVTSRDGIYEHCFTTSILHEEYEFSYRDCSYTWKDGKLAVGYYPKSLQFADCYRSDIHCVFSVAVYDKTGMIYDARYISSLAYPHLAYGNYGYDVNVSNCAPTYQEPYLVLQWK